ncbi:GGDEF domain-containing protein [Sphingomonas sp. ID0503]|uniref:GGDEF domain-containing protein n=1 Tax=Sphingomonas sp. ID0503 TaxID=3399691 RepID=UPI003AFB515F
MEEVEPSTVGGWWESVIDEDRAAAFLRWNNLPQTSANEELAGALLSLRPQPGKDRTEAAAAEAQALTSLVARTCDTLGSVSTVMNKTGAAVRAYGDALETEAAAIEDGSDPEAVLRAFVGLTRAMIARSLAAQEELQAMRDEIHTLQANLIEARTNARHDVLTALPNRRAIEEALEASIARAAEIGQEVVLALCDIDHFKQINDRHGHNVGDRMLRLVADRLAEAAGPDCFVGRHGGEEFLLLFEGVPLPRALARIDALREDLARRNLRNRENDQPIGRVTFSAGLAALAPDEGREAFVARADTALYRAKGNGRNRVEVDDSPPPASRS